LSLLVGVTFAGQLHLVPLLEAPLLLVFVVFVEVLAF